MRAGEHCVPHMIDRPPDHVSQQLRTWSTTSACSSSIKVRRVCWFSAQYGFHVETWIALRHSTGRPPQQAARARPHHRISRTLKHTRQEARSSATDTISQGQGGAPGPTASKRPVLQTLASAETQSHTRQKCGISLEVVAPAAHTPVLSRRRQPGRRCAAHL